MWKVLTDNKDNFIYFDRALRRQRFQDLAFADPAAINLRTPLVIFRKIRVAGVLNALRARFLFHTGNKKEALDTAVKNLEMGQFIQESQGPFIGYLVGSTVKANGLDTIRAMIPFMDFPSQRLLAFGRRLERYKNNEEGLIKAFKMEYIVDLNNIEKIFGVRVSGRRRLGL